MHIVVKRLCTGLAHKASSLLSIVLSKLWSIPDLQIRPNPYMWRPQMLHIVVQCGVCMYKRDWLVQRLLCSSISQGLKDTEYQ